MSFSALSAGSPAAISDTSGERDNAALGTQNPLWDLDLADPANASLRIWPPSTRAPCGAMLPLSKVAMLPVGKVAMLPVGKFAMLPVGKFAMLPVGKFAMLPVG